LLIFWSESTIFVKIIRFLVNFYGFTEAIAQRAAANRRTAGPPRGDGFGATPSIIPYKSTKNQLF
jgi:hypothetical protein